MQDIRFLGNLATSVAAVTSLVAADRGSEGADMVLVAVLGLLAVFSIISIVMSPEHEAPRPTEALDNPYLWALLGRR